MINFFILRESGYYPPTYLAHQIGKVIGEFSYVNIFVHCFIKDDLSNTMRYLIILTASLWR